MRARRVRERGAVMLSALVMCTFLVAVLWYVVGVADAITRKQRLQDASDTAAYDAAVVHARGMNAIAFVNLMMAAGVSALTALKHGILGGFVVLSGDEERMQRTLRYLSSTADYIASETPWLAETKAARDAASQGMPVHGGLALSTSLVPSGARLGLPVEADRSDRYCAIAEELTKLPRAGIDFDAAAFCDGSSAMAEMALKKAFAGSRNGDDHHAIWGFAWTSRDPSSADRRMWSLRGKKDSSIPKLDPGRAVAVARAEHYYDDPGGPRPWAQYAPDTLYHLRWRARLRRVRAPERGEDAATMRSVLRGRVRSTALARAANPDAASADDAFEWIDSRLEQLSTLHLVH